MRREEAERGVAPVVAGAARGERRLRDGVVHRQQLDRRDAERGQVLDRGRVREAGVRALDVLGDERVLAGVALDVRLVEDRLAPRRGGRRVVAPVEAVGDDDAARHVRRGVARVGARRVGRHDRPRHVGGGDVAGDRAGVRVDQELVRVEPQAVVGNPGPVRAEAVLRADPDAGEEPVVHTVAAGLERHPHLLVAEEEARLDQLCGRRPDGEVEALRGPGGAERCGEAGRPDHRRRRQLVRGRVRGHARTPWDGRDRRTAGPRARPGDSLPAPARGRAGRSVARLAGPGKGAAAAATRREARRTPWASSCTSRWRTASARSGWTARR